MTETWLWIGFGAFIASMLAVDLGVLNRKAHVISVGEAGRWTAVVVTMAAIFNGWIFHERGSEAGLQFLTGYLIELALSVDNVFVFILIFSYFRVPPAFQHRVLFWGVFGAIMMRGAMIGVGWLLLDRFHWILYLFGAFLIVTGIRMATHNEIAVEPEANPLLRLIRRYLPVTPAYEGQRFFVRARNKSRFGLLATPLFVVLIMVETTDLVFAVDSIPAIFAITMDPFLVFTSNVFAILGLRSMCFLLIGIIDRFHFLKLGVALVLTFIGTKMLAGYWGLHMPVGVSLGVVAFTLGASVAASLIFPRPAKPNAPVESELGYPRSPQQEVDNGGPGRAPPRFRADDGHIPSRARRRP